jgi:DNA-binding HxlR family transcriptional regulator
MPRPLRPSASSGASGGCHISEIFATLGRAHTLDILHLFLTQRPKSVRFIDVQEQLRLSPNTVSERLKTLVKTGLLARNVYHEVPPRVEYTVTPKLVELTPVFESLAAWSRRNDLVAPASPLPILGGMELTSPFRRSLAGPSANRR